MQNQDDSTSNSIDNTSSNITVKVEKVDTLKKFDKKDDVEDPKPRIVLTFRSEKSGAKSSNMKIVTPEEKQEEVSPRRSSRTRQVKVDYDENEIMPSRIDKSLSSQPASENDELSDSSYAKRPPRRHSKEISDGSSKATIKKEMPYNETPTPPQRLSRRIKPTAKILANEELRIGLESQNNARLGILSDKPEEGVSTRRTGQGKSVETAVPDRKSAKRKSHTKDMDENLDNDNSVMKLKHLCELGLKAIIKSPNRESSEDNENSETNLEGGEEDTEIDDDTEIINKLLEADEEWGSDSSDDDYLLSEENSQSGRPRRSRRLYSIYGTNDSDHSSLAPNEEKTKSRLRRSSRRKIDKANCMSVYQTEREFETDSIEGEFSKRKKTRSFDPDNVKLEIDEEENWDFAPKRKKNRSFEHDEEKTVNDEENSITAAADEGSEAAEPADASAVVATCFCEEPSNVYASPDELTEPVFCQAIEMVDGVRAGCSHGARREGEGAEGGGALAPLVRAGPRSPYILACRLHTAQLAKHMCCPTCGVFCTQGIFYQCSKGHLFHTECGVLSADAKLKPGCPHCGVTAYGWQPANRDCGKVQLQMHCSNERVYLPDQRVQCTPAYLSFSTSKKVTLDSGPLLPEDLLPSLPIDLKKMCAMSPSNTEGQSSNSVEQLYEAIVNGETIEQLIPKIVRGERLGAALAACGGGTCAHAAAARGRLAALYLLQYAGAPLDALDAAGRTPLMLAVLALLDKDSHEEMEVEVKEEIDIVEDKRDEEEQVDDEVEKVAVKVKVKRDDTDDKIRIEDDEKEENDKEAAGDKPSDEDLLKVIRYLIAAGCDLNIAGPEGMTALHMAAQFGGEAACALLLEGGAEVDARDDGGWTPLVRACENGHADVVRVLAGAGADACATDAQGSAAVHWCALGGSAAAMRALLAAAPHAAAQRTRHHDTPLHIAARAGHYACVVVLLARGAPTDVENTAGELPVEVCAGQCQAAVSLNMQMALAARDSFARRRLLDSDISRGREPFPVECVNEVDDEPPPRFTYVTRHLAPEPLAVDRSLRSMQGCSCAEGACAHGGCECGALGVRRWYRGGRLPPAFPYHDPPMLFECNQTCACDLRRCTNHVVSAVEARGSLGARVGVFRAGGARGWGLRARQRVPRGAPVALYCGELLPRAAADARDHDHYMFALDLKPDLLDQCAERTPLCVDAARAGSCARFVNHSCRPNLAPVRVFTAARDLRVPAVALFALRDIADGEELTFDYGDKFWAVKSKWMHCECGEPDCRYPKTVDNES